MGTRVNIRPQQSSISNALVNAPVSANVASRWSGELGFLHCKNVQPVVSQSIRAQVANGTIRVVYNRSPGVDLIRVDVQPHLGTGAGSLLTIVVTSTPTALDIISGGQLDGIQQIEAGNGLVRNPVCVTSYFDVTAMTPGVAEELIITWADINKTVGVAYLHVVECPKYDTDPMTAPTTEMGLDGSWVTPGNEIFDGSGSTKNGILRIVDQLDRARYQVRRHMQISTAENTLTSWEVISAGSADVPFRMHNNAITFRGRARNLYASGANLYTAYVRYQHSGANTGTVAFQVTPVGGALTTTTCALANSGTWATASCALSIPTTGTDQEFGLSFKSSTTSGTQYLAMLSIVENES